MWPGLQVKGVREKRWLRSAGGVIDETPLGALVATHDLPIYQAGPNAEVVHSLHHQREAASPVIAAPDNEPDADGISTRHKAIAVVLDLVNPVGAGRRAVGRRRQAGLDETQNRHSGGYIAPALTGIESVRTGLKKAPQWRKKQRG
jgi:hypothetical protein